MVDAAKYSTYFEDLKPHLDKMPNVKKFLNGGLLVAAGGKRRDHSRDCSY